MDENKYVSLAHSAYAASKWDGLDGNNEVKKLLADLADAVLYLLDEVAAAEQAIGIDNNTEDFWRDENDE